MNTNRQHKVKPYPVKIPIYRGFHRSTSMSSASVRSIIGDSSNGTLIF